MIPYQHKAIGISEGPETCWKGNLRCFIDNAIIKFSFVKDETIVRKVSGNNILINSKTCGCDNERRSVLLM